MENINIIVGASTLFIIFGILILLTNIIVEVLKKLIAKDTIHIPFLVVIVSLFLTISSIVGLCEYFKITIIWQYIGAGLVLSLLVSYCSMFGYDNIIKELKKLIEALLNK